MKTTSSKSTQKQLFVTAYNENFTELVRYAQGKVSDYEAARDLVQEAFLRAWIYMRDGKEITNMKSFLYHALKNLIVDKYRKQKTLSLDTLVEYGYEPSFNDSERLINILDGRVAITLIDQLPVKYRKILRMKYKYDLTPGEIAKKSGTSSNSVNVYVHRGLAKLRLLYASRGRKPVLA